METPEWFELQPSQKCDVLVTLGAGLRLNLAVKNMHFFPVGISRFYLGTWYMALLAPL